MHHSVAVRIRFKLKRFSPEPVAFHLVGVETLNFLDEPINFCVHVGPDGSVAGPEVDEVHEPWNPQGFLHRGFHNLRLHGLLNRRIHDRYADRRGRRIHPDKHAPTPAAFTHLH